MACAGFDFAPRPKRLFKTVGMLLHYSDYLNSSSLGVNRFSEPEPSYSDPTEKGQFSNIAGRAIADFLSKRIYDAIFSVTYEAGLKVIGKHISNRKKDKRPDLWEFSLDKGAFAVEAKGYERNTITDTGNKKYSMDIIKQQSKTNEIPVDFHVTSVIYNIYRNIKCKFYDPFISNNGSNNNLVQLFSKLYYSNFAEFLQSESVSDLERVNYDNVDFYKIPVYELASSILIYPSFSLLVPCNIKVFAEAGIPPNIQPFKCTKNDASKYIDYDYIGIECSSPLEES
jgi:hypothetical protein